MTELQTHISDVYPQLLKWDKTAVNWARQRPLYY